MRHALFALAAALVPAPLASHPHLFIDAGLVLVLDGENRLLEVQLTRTYDAFYSMVELADRGIDPAADGTLKPEERAALLGFDAALAGTEEGDLYLTRSGARVAFREPEPVSVWVWGDGRISSTLAWRPETPLEMTEPLTIKTYDRTYYAAYTMTGGAEIVGGQGCAVSVVPADLDAAYTMVEELLYGPGGGDSADEAGGFPEVGEAFADAVTLTCAGS